MPRTPARAVRIGAAACATLMLWSWAGSTPASGQEQPVTEPSELSGYATLSDAMPIQNYFDHQVRLVPLGPAIAHSQAEVAMPSQASGISWLVDNGIANGLNGTTTGNKVPTEASAKQPGGDPTAEFKVAGGPIGNDALMRVGAGRSFARAASTESPEGYASAYIGNVVVLPAAGSPDDPPGTFDPDARSQSDPDETDPNPQGQMAILSIGSIASNARSFRDGPTVTSIAVAELKDINIGNRTSDNRCTNCMRFDSIRAEAYAQANGTPGGSRAAYRVILGRACRRAFNANEGKETDECLPLDPQDPEGNKGLRSIDQLKALNDFFEHPIWETVTGGAVDYMVGIQIHAGDHHTDTGRKRRTVSPSDDPERNYAYPRDGKGDKDQGQEARALAEGFDVSIWTVTLTQGYDDAARRIAGTPAQVLIDQVDQDDDEPGVQIPGPTGSQQTIPIESIRTIRREQLTLGVARAAATARPAFVASITTPSTGTGPAAFGGDLGGSGLGGGAPAEASGGTGVTGAPTGGVGGGPLSLKIDWSSIRIKPWPPADMAKAIASMLIAAGALFLLRRRLGLR